MFWWALRLTSWTGYSGGGQGQKEVHMAENLFSLNTQSLPMLSKPTIATVSHLTATCPTGKAMVQSWSYPPSWAAMWLFLSTSL